MLFRKIIAKNLFITDYTHYYIENKNHLPKSQCGFRRNHSCLDILLYLGNYIQLALRTQQILVIVFFDIN